IDYIDCLLNKLDSRRPGTAFLRRSLGLSAMQAAAFGCNLAVGAAKRGIEFACVDFHTHGVVRVAHSVQVELFRLPGLSVFRKSRRIGGRLESFLGDESSDLVMPMPVSRR